MGRGFFPIDLVTQVRGLPELLEVSTGFLQLGL